MCLRVYASTNVFEMMRVFPPILKYKIWSGNFSQLFEINHHQTIVLQFALQNRLYRNVYVPCALAGWRHHFLLYGLIFKAERENDGQVIAGISFARGRETPVFVCEPVCIDGSNPWALTS